MFKQKVIYRLIPFLFRTSYIIKKYMGDICYIYKLYTDSRRSLQ